MREDEQPVEAYLDGLSGRTRRALADAGFGMERLRQLGTTPSGARQVRHIVTEFGVLPDRDGRFVLPGDRREVAAGWAWALLAVLVGLAAVVAASIWAGRPVGLLVAFVAGAVLAVLALRTPESRGREPAVLIALAAGAVLYFTAFMNAPQWYLAVHGKDATATLDTPALLTRGGHVRHCRVELPDGRVRQVDHDNRTCLARAGQTVHVVYDPSDNLAPELGTKNGLGTISGTVAVASLAVLTATATAAVSAAGPRTRLRGPDGR